MLNPDVIHYNELRITGTYGYWPKHLDIAIELLKRKKIDTSILRFPILPLDEINRAFKIYGKKGSMKVGISIP
jgi:threonine dehydrogenase-like Zn-dependent dehydrogenase